MVEISNQRGGRLKDKVVIGGAAGAWGDTSFAVPQLLASERCDYLIFDALAEITMGILTRARQKAPAFGYATDIIEMIGRDVAELRRQGVRVVTNAGGVHPHAAATRLRNIAEEAGVALRIATVTGDDLMPKLTVLREAGVTDLGRTDKLHNQPLSMNAYLGAWPIAAALDAGADVVITGRCADSALALGPLIHEFGWQSSDWDALAKGSLAGHLLECGPQSTGGLLTDWEDVSSWEDLGYPLAECRPNGSFVVTKPLSSGGLVDVRTVSEQLLYEIGDPGAYLLPDVTCDFRDVRLTELGADRVLVEGARGMPPPPDLKVCAQVPDGFKTVMSMFVAGRGAVPKAERLGAEMLRRAQRVIARDGFSDLRAHDIEVLGAESTYGPRTTARAAREVVLKVALHHDESIALQKVVREFASFGLAVVGLSGGGAGLPRPSQRLRLDSFVVPRAHVQPEVQLDGERIAYEEPIRSFLPPKASFEAKPVEPSLQTQDSELDMIQVPLWRLAHGRSGDKGADANIGLRARRPEYLPRLRQVLTAEVVADWFAHRIEGPVQRYELPGTQAFNFVLRDSLGGGGSASLRMDAQGKGYAQQLLDMPVWVPKSWFEDSGGSFALRNDHSERSS